MRRVLALARKDLRLLVRDRMDLFWALGFPLLMALFFGTLFGGGGGNARAIAVAVIDEDGTPQSRQLADRLAASEALSVDATLSLDEARDRVRRGKLVAYVRIGKGFGATFNVFGAQSPIELGLDPARGPERGILQGVLMGAAFQSLQQRMTDPAAMRDRVREGLTTLPPAESATGQDKVMRDFLQGLDTFLGDVDQQRYREGLAFGGGGGGATGTGGGGLEAPFRMTDVARDEGGRPRTPFDIAFPSAALWGVLGCAATFALSIVKERLNGTLLRLRAAPLRRWEILAGKGLACWTACVIALVALLAFGRVLLGMHLGSVPLLLPAVAATAWCFTGFMMLLAVSGRTLSSVSGISWAFNVTAAMLGGAMLPLAFMPGWLRAVSHVSPVKWGVLALEGAIWRDFTLAEMLGPLAVLVISGAAAFAAGAWIEGRREG